MKKLFLLTIIFTINNISAQIFVSPNSFVYVSDKFLFVTKETNLQNNGNILLRNEAQLLQATTGLSTNVGEGKLSLYQEGSANAYQYNFWCSPIGNASATVANEPFGITMLNRPTTVTVSTPAITTYHADYNGISNPLEVEPYWIYKYQINTGSANEDWIFTGTAPTIAAGEGFTMKGTNGTDSTTILGVQNNSGVSLPLFGGKQRYDFRGKPNDGNINSNVATAKLTLTGNPYPSAIDLTAFLTSATNSTGIAYFWESDKAVSSHYSADYVGGYGTFSPVSRGGTGIYVPATFYAYDQSGNQLAAVGSGSSYQRRFCPIGQGFLLEGSSTGTVQMNNTHRVVVKEGVANFSQFERNSSLISRDFLPEIASVSGFDYTTVSALPVPQIRFKALINNRLITQSVLAFDPTATDGVDFAMDAKNANTDMEEDFYLAINNKPFCIDVIDFDIYKKIPVGLKNNQPANFKISVNEILNFNDAKNVYIHDKQNDSYHDIKNGVYEISMPIGNNFSRFEITFIDKNYISNLSSDLDIFQNNPSEILSIGNPKELDLVSVSLFDLTGKLIVEKTTLGIKTSYKIPTSSLSDAIYIAKVVATNGTVVTKKISVYKSK